MTAPAHPRRCVSAPGDHQDQPSSPYGPARRPAPPVCYHIVTMYREGRAVPDVVEIEAFLRAEGFTTPAAMRQARATLEARGLTRPGKRGMAADKQPAARDALAAGILRHC